MKKYGFSFSLSRLLGLTTFKQKVAKKLVYQQQNKAFKEK